MRMISLLHVPFEDAANIETWARRCGHTLKSVMLYKNDALPQMDAFDFLAVMGGPMNVYEHKDYPWLIQEKQFIRRAIDAGKKVIGVCLGAQLIADVLGGKVTQNSHKEIGWHTVRLTPAAAQLPLLNGLDEELTVFQWHGDTFTLPPGAVHLASAPACANQAFLYGSNVLGLQFHLEYSKDSILSMLTHCADELTPSPYVQTAAHIQQNLHLVSTIEQNLYALLDRFTAL